MARATYIWLVFDGAAALPMAVFTVKHEMKTWLQRNCEPEAVKVYRYPDGRYEENGIMELNIAELFS